MSRNKPESILIVSSEITDPQSKKPGLSSNPTVEKKERPSDISSRDNDYKRENMDIEVKNSNEINLGLILVTGFFTLFFGLLGIISNLRDFDGDVFCFSSIIFVIGLYLFLQSFSQLLKKG